MTRKKKTEPEQPLFVITAGDIETGQKLYPGNEPVTEFETVVFNELLDFRNKEPQAANPRQPNGPGRKRGSCEVEYQTDLENLARSKKELTYSEAFDQMPERYPDKYRIDPSRDKNRDKLVKLNGGRDVTRASFRNAWANAKKSI